MYMQIVQASNPQSNLLEFASNNEPNVQLACKQQQKDVERAIGRLCKCSQVVESVVTGKGRMQHATKLQQRGLKALGLWIF